MKSFKNEGVIGCLKHFFSEYVRLYGVGQAREWDNFKGTVHLDQQTIQYGEQVIDYQEIEDTVVLSQNPTELMDETLERMVRLAQQQEADELKMLLSAPEAYSWPDLRKNVLNRAIDEINLQIDDMDLQLNVGKRGRKVVHVEIANLFYPRKPNLHDEDFEPVPMVDWMKDFK